MATSLPSLALEQGLLSVESTPTKPSWRQSKTLSASQYYALCALIAVLAITTAVSLSLLWSTASSSSSSALGYGIFSSSARSSFPDVAAAAGPNDPMVYQGRNAVNSINPANIPRYPASSLVGQIKTYTLLSLLSTLYSIAMDNGGNRAVQNPGFNASVQFIENTIRTRTNLVNIEKSYFSIFTAATYQNANFDYIIGRQPPQSFLLNTDYYFYRNSPTIQRPSWTETVYVPYGGCSTDDWDLALGPEPPTIFWAILESNASCADNVRIGNAQANKALGLIISNTQEIQPNRLQVPVNTVPVVLSMIPKAASVLIEAIKYGGTSAVVISSTAVLQRTEVRVTNICGDTPAGDPTSVVLVGGHSDGVAAGPGTNDDGSGTVATLTLAIAMTRLMQDPTVNYKPVNMVKFCWFGAEENGLLGSAEVVRVAVQRDVDPFARVGSRAKDWAIMVDLDMLGSLNYMNWVYDANTYIPPSTPVRAHQGSKILSNIFFDFFDSNKLPRKSETFDGRSDYGPFLVAGIPAGGVFAGADKIKSEADRQLYLNTTSWGGVSGEPGDQCYHQACDAINNIQWEAYTNQTMSAAYVLDLLALKPGLRDYLGNQLSNSPQESLPYSHLPFEYRFSVLTAENEGEELEIIM